ncbi:YlbF family regulator [Thermoflavimicrobium daqui]|jgi:cell fate (sporulation/competence/biofilm development) regulator YlbF (YheA/YmcA/DUF963 family)|nr:YlbF family regulator [Thermoflavimicrobium daqui]
MQNAYDLAHQLARTIRKSNVYQEWKEAYQEVEDNPKYKEMISTFRKTQVEMQQLLLEGKQPSEEQQEQMKKLSMAIQGVPAIIKCLQAEERFGILMNDLQKIIYEPAKELFDTR